MRQMWDVRFTLEHRPGSLAEVAERLGAEGVNIEGVAGNLVSGHGQVNVLVEDHEATLRVLRDLKVTAVEAHEVLVIRVDNTPGVLGRYTTLLASEGVNLEWIYTTVTGELAVGVDKVDVARRAWETLTPAGAAR